MKKYLIILSAVFIGVAFFSVPETRAEYCYNTPNRPIIGNAAVFWGNPPGPNITAAPTDIVRFSLEGTFPGSGGDCQGVVALIEISVDGDPTNVVRTAAGGLLPGSQIQSGPMGSWQWYIDWPINNRLFDGRYRFRVVALDGAPINNGNLSSNVLIIVGAGPPPPPPPPPPSCSTGFSPNSIILGQATTQNWTALNDADNQVSYSCTGNIGSGTLPATGSRSVTPTTTQDCTFTAINSAGSSAVCSAAVTVNAPPPPTVDITCNGTQGPCSVAYNGSAVIGWNSTNTTSCSVSPGGWTGTSGSQNSGALTVSQTYTINCSGLGGTASDSVSVNVASAPLASCNVSFSPGTIISGQTSMETWTSLNDADGTLQYSCTGNLGSGSTIANGSSTVTPSASQTCTFTAVNSAGTSAPCSAAITVNPLLPTATINCSSCNITYDTSDQISWSSTNTTSCTVSPSGWTGASGSQNTGNLTTTTIYTLDCTSPGGPVSAFTVINVAPPVIPSNPPTPLPTPIPPPPVSQSVFDGLRIPNPFSGPNGIRTLDDLFRVIINFLYYIAGPIVVIMIVTAGLIFLFARDDSGKVQTARKLLTYSVIGLVIILIGRGFIELLRTILALGTP